MTLAPANPTFLGLPQGTPDALSESDVALIGIPEATPYLPGKSSHASGAPAAIRHAMSKFADWSGHYDFDTGGPLIRPNSPLFDLGDLAGDPAEPEQNRERISAMISQILEARAVPVILGGDDSVPIPVLEAYCSEPPLWVVQIDAHLDWRDEREGVREGWSSPMRRASEMSWVSGLVQVGLRGSGSAQPEDVRDAERYGALIYTARDIHTHGIRTVIDAVPQGSRCFLTIDCDGLDPSIMPAVLSPVPGGLSYWHVIELIEALRDRATIVGFDLVELAPARDVNGLGALTAGRIIYNLSAAISKK